MEKTPKVKGVNGGKTPKVRVTAKEVQDTEKEAKEDGLRHMPFKDSVLGVASTATKQPIVGLQKTFTATNCRQRRVEAREAERTLLKTTPQQRLKLL